MCQVLRLVIGFLVNDNIMLKHKTNLGYLQNELKKNKTRVRYIKETDRRAAEKNTKRNKREIALFIATHAGS